MKTVQLGNLTASKSIDVLQVVLVQSRVEQISKANKNNAFKTVSIDVNCLEMNCMYV